MGSASCMFCGAPGPLTREHVWPLWLRKQFPPAKSNVRHRRGTGGRSNEWHAPPFKQTVREVCGECNNGWMNDLESGVRLTLSAMLAGQSATLEQEDQALLAAWGTKTAMMCALSTSDKRLFPASHHSALYNSRLNPRSPALRVVLFRYGEDQWASYWRGHPLTVTAHGVEDSLAYGATLAIGKVGFHIFGCESPHYHLQPRTGPMEARFLRQIWPYVQPVTWGILPAMSGADMTSLAESFFI